MHRDEYETELTGDRDELAAALEGVADGLRAGSLRLGSGEEALAVDVPEELTLEVEFEVENDERSLELELEWEATEGADDISAVAIEEPHDEAADDTAVGEPPAENRSREGSSEPETETETPVEDGSPDVSVPDTDTTAAASEGDEPAAEAAEPAETLPIGPADAPASLGRFELYRDRADEWRWRLRHRNGNIIASSGEGYTRKANAQKGLWSVMRNAPGAVVRDE